MIYQHKKNKECTYPEDNKKYSQNEQQRSFENGINILEKKIVYYNLLIHNSGNKKNISNIYDYGFKQNISDKEQIMSYWLDNN